jgi:molecular chaperone GrpE
VENKNKINNLEQASEEQAVTEEQAQPSTEDLSQTLSAKTEELKVLQDKYLRLAAEFENYKRISQREQREASRFANETLLKELIPILDNLERAIKSAKDSPAGNGLMEGVQLTLKQFIETIGKFGVRQVSSVGAPFDPSCHQAVVRIESADRAPNTVMEEYQRGYLLHDRLLRAAMVAVAVAPEEPPAEGPAGPQACEAPADATDS